jgi:phosphohistidine phosphatase
MKRLYLIRHAKSSWAEPGLPDFERPLNGRGKTDAPFMGRRLADHGVRPDLIVSSPAKRARKTARCIAEAVGFARDSIRFDETIYEAEVPSLLGAIARVPAECETLFFVGHNFGISDLAAWLLGRDIGVLPTCGIVGIEFDGLSWPDLSEGSGRLLFVDFPKKHPDRS